MRILFVCAGNICRSVIAECVAKERARQMLGGAACALEVESGGINAESDSAPHPECRRALELIDVPFSGTTSTLVDEGHMAAADLVITMTRQQCYVLASRFPEHRRKCFSLIEMNGAIETLLSGREREGETRGRPGALPEADVRRLLDSAVDSLHGASRELMRPLAGVPMDVRELMTLFSPCFYQVSGIHDPLGGTEDEIERCASQIDREVTAILEGLLALGAVGVEQAAG